MQAQEKINKAAWNLFETAKDAVTTNLTNAIRSGQLKIEANQVPSLLALLGSSIDEGFHRGASGFNRVVIAAMADAADDSEQAKHHVAKKKPG